MESYVLIHTLVGRAGDVAKAVSRLSCVEHAAMVTGPYDVIARVEGDCQKDISTFVTEEVQPLPGVARALTCPIMGRHRKPEPELESVAV